MADAQNVISGDRLLALANLYVARSFTCPLTHILVSLGYFVPLVIECPIREALGLLVSPSFSWENFFGQRNDKSVMSADYSTLLKVS